MGNQSHKRLTSCCSQDFWQGKKEVNINPDKFESEGITPRILDKDQRYHKASNDYDFPLKKAEVSQLEFKSNTHFHDDFDKLQYLEEVCSTAPLLILRVLNSPTLPKGSEITINAQGVERSLRGKKDGITYFGCPGTINKYEKQGDPGEVSVDFALDLQNSDLNERNKHLGRHFQIEYSIDSNKYKIRDLGVGFGAFVRLDEPLSLKNNNLLSMGTSFLVVNLEGEDDDSLINTEEVNRTRELNFKSTQNEDFSRRASTDQVHSEITIKIFGGANYGEIFRFDARTPLVRIGRMPDCEIKLDDGLISKYQASMRYVPKSGWILHDGYNGKPSTNNNWLYLNDDYEMFDGMVFKANHTLFEVHIRDEVKN